MLTAGDCGCRLSPRLPGGRGGCRWRGVGWAGGGGCGVRAGGGGKAADQGGTRQAVQDFGVPARLVPVAAWALPAVELMVTAAVLPPGRSPGCSCFGAVSTAPV